MRGFYKLNCLILVRFFRIKKNKGKNDINILRPYFVQKREKTNESIDFVKGSKLKYSPNKLKFRSNSEKQIKIKNGADLTQFKLQRPDGIKFNHSFKKDFYNFFYNFYF